MLHLETNSYSGTAAQIVPAIAPEVKSLTQIIRSKHWVFKAANMKYSSLMKWSFKHFPGAMALHRLAIFLAAESSLSLFYMNKRGAEARAKRRVIVEEYMRDKAPAKYHSLLIPEFDVGCKVRIQI